MLRNVQSIPNSGKTLHHCLVLHADLHPQGNCATCVRRSDWDFLRDFYAREEINKQQIQSLNGHLVELNGALRHTTSVAQRERIALKQSYEQMNRLETHFRHSEGERAKFENDLHEERQENRRLQESLTHEKMRHQEAEKNVEMIWNAHKRLGQIVANVDCHVERKEHEGYSGYNMTELVLELEAQHCKVNALETEQQHREERDRVVIRELEDRLQTAERLHSKELAAQASKISGLEHDLCSAQNASSALVPYHQTRADNNRVKRRGYRGRGKSGVEAVKADSQKEPSVKFET